MLSRDLNLLPPRWRADTLQFELRSQVVLFKRQGNLYSQVVQLYQICNIYCLNHELKSYICIAVWFLSRGQEGVDKPDPSPQGRGTSAGVQGWDRGTVLFCWYHLIIFLSRINKIYVDCRSIDEQSRQLPAPSGGERFRLPANSIISVLL